MARSWAEGECRRRAWAVATVAGAAVGLALWAFGGVPPSLAAGLWIAVTAALGLFLGWAFCTSSRGYRAAEAAAGARPPASPPDGGPPAPPSTAPPAPPDRPSPSAGTRPVVPPDGPVGDGPGQAAAPVVALLQPRPVDETQALRPGAAKPVARRSAEESGILGAVQRSHLRTSAMADPASGRQGGAGTFRPLPGPRGGIADDLKLIRGIGPALEAMLNAEGVWHFDQIAAWKARDIAAIDARLGRFYGRITRDGWVRQARILAAAGPAALDGTTRQGAAGATATTTPPDGPARRGDDDA